MRGAFLFCPLLAVAAFAAEEISAVLPGGTTLDMVWIEPGTFLMGSPESEPGRYDWEATLVETSIERGFYLGRYEVTQEQWQSVMGTAPWRATGLDRLKNDVREGPLYPAAYVSWHGARAFVQRLNEASGDSLYRLPTEAEWEYACRAGTSTAWSFGQDESQLPGYAWYRDNASRAGERYPHEVGTKLANDWGLYDMHGNVEEWCQDQFVPFGQTQPESDVRVIRGGGYFSEPRRNRSAYRGHDSPSGQYATFGLRLLRLGPPVTGVSPESWGRVKDRF